MADSGAGVGTSGRSMWLAEPTGSYHEQPIKHLFDPGHVDALCGKRRAPGWKRTFDGLRCSHCVDEEEAL